MAGLGGIYIYRERDVDSWSCYCCCHCWYYQFNYVVEFGVSESGWVDRWSKCKVVT